MSEPLVASCLVDGCEDDVRTKGYCGAHYRRHRLGKDLAAPMRRRRLRITDGPCSVDGCTKLRFAKTLCEMHYSRDRRHGDVDRGHRRYPCSVDGCESPAQARKLCASCYQAAKYRGEFGAARCSVEGCSTLARARDLCGMHYARSQRGLELSAPRMRREWGTGTHDRNGYIQIPMPDGSTRMEHRIVMEAMLGRELADRENVHHINGIKNENRPENLELWVKPQPNGQRVSDLIRWVVENYREDVLSVLAEGGDFS